MRKTSLFQSPVSLLYKKGVNICRSGACELAVELRLYQETGPTKCYRPPPMANFAHQAASTGRQELEGWFPHPGPRVNPLYTRGHGAVFPNNTKKH